MASATKEDVELEKTVVWGGRLGGDATEDGSLIRPMSGQDLDRILELRATVGWPADPRAFDLLRGMREARWAVAEARAGELVGMVGAVPLGGIGILCHLAVHDGHRRAGLGARLTARAVAYLRSRGARTIRLYSTPQAEGIYRSAGFEPVALRTVYRLEGAPRKLRASDGEHRVETFTGGALPEVYGVDRWSYGADRSALIRATLELHPGHGLVARDSGGRIKGYLVRSASPRVTLIGPFLASTPAVARLLLAEALKDGVAPIEATVTGPKESPAHELFEEFEFTSRENRLRMERGATPSGRAGLEHYGTTPYLAT